MPAPRSMVALAGLAPERRQALPDAEGPGRDDRSRADELTQMLVEPSEEQLTLRLLLLGLLDDPEQVLKQLGVGEDRVVRGINEQIAHTWRLPLGEAVANRRVISACPG